MIERKTITSGSANHTKYQPGDVARSAVFGDVGGRKGWVNRTVRTRFAVK